MKITAIDLVRIDRPPPKPSKHSRHESRNVSALRALPINVYPEFSRSIWGIPGVPSAEAWVRITAENGQWGLGQCHWGNLIAPLIRDFATPLLLGRDCLAIEFLNDLLWRAGQCMGAEGLAAVARSGIDLALWDLKGKLLGVPVYSLLGGPCRESIDCYATTDDLEWGLELGFKAFKLSNPIHYREGTEGINRLEQFVAQARETVGPDADLMINPVMSFNAEYGIQVMERLLPYRLRWFEEPLMTFDTDGLEQMKRAVPTLPIATGENHFGRHAFRELVERRCVDLLQPDFRWCGGLTEGLKIYAIGEAAGIATSPHFGASEPAGQHFSFAMPEIGLAEVWLFSDPGVPLEEANQIPGLPVPKNGRVTPSDAPGFGLEFKTEHLISW